MDSGRESIDRGKLKLDHEDQIVQLHQSNSYYRSSHRTPDKVCGKELVGKLAFSYWRCAQRSTFFKLISPEQNFQSSPRAFPVGATLSKQARKLQSIAI